MLVYVTPPVTHIFNYKYSSVGLCNTTKVLKSRSDPERNQKSWSYRKKRLSWTVKRTTSHEEICGPELRSGNFQRRIHRSFHMSWKLSRIVDWFVNHPFPELRNLAFHGHLYIPWMGIQPVKASVEDDLQNSDLCSFCGHLHRSWKGVRSMKGARRRLRRVFISVFSHTFYV